MVSVILGCALRPVILDIGGLIPRSIALTRVEERLSRLLDGSNHQSLSSSSPKSRLIPEHNSWIVTMWHCGIDSPKECTGEKFECTWEQGKNALIRIYKDLKDGKGISVRTERQGYPNKRFDLAIEEKLNALGSSRLRNRYVVSQPYVLSYYYIIMSHMGSSFVVCSSTRQN
ncbi:MAG: hypothetical protein WCA39_14245 [Nitrososphaeraceae archaeon]